MPSRLRLSPLPALAALALLAPAGSARDQIVTSFDGTPLSTSFFPAAGLEPGQKAPTVLVTHGWGLERSRDENEASLEAIGSTGVGPLRKAGFNVLTWDSRGFGESGGTVTVDFKDNEGRDVVSLISWLAGQPEAPLDKPGDPRVGMHGASYRLQIIGGSQVYGPVRDAASIDFSSIRLTLPTASPSGFSGPGASGGSGVLPARRRCLSRRRKQRIRVRIVARTRSGKRLRDTRVYRTCTPTKHRRHAKK